MDELLSNLLLSHIEENETLQNHLETSDEIVIRLKLFGVATLVRLGAAADGDDKRKSVDYAKRQMVRQCIPTLKKIISRVTEIPPPTEPPCTSEWVDETLTKYDFSFVLKLKKGTADLLRQYIEWQGWVIRFMAKESAYDEGVRVGYEKAKQEERERQEDTLRKLTELKMAVAPQVNAEPRRVAK